MTQKVDFCGRKVAYYSNYLPNQDCRYSTWKTWIPILLLTHLNSNTNTSTVTLNFSHPTRSSNFVWVFKQRLFLYRIAFPYKNSRGKRFQWILAAAIEWESGKEIVKNGIFSWMLVYNCYEVPTLGQMLKSKISSQGDLVLLILKSLYM